MEELQNLISRIRKDPEAHREEYLKKWDEFLASFAVLHLTPHIYRPNTVELLSFITQTLPLYQPKNQRLVDITAVANLYPYSSTAVELSQTKGYTINPQIADMDSLELGKDLCMMLFDFVKKHRLKMNQKMLKQFISTTFILRSKRLVDIFTVLPEWLGLLDLENCQVRSRLFVFIVRDLIAISEKVKDMNVIRPIQRLFINRLKPKVLQIQLLCCCIIAEMFRRRLWREKNIVNSIANCTLASNPKLCLAGAHFLLGTKNHFDVAFYGENDAEEELAKLEDLSRQQPYVGLHSKKTEGRQNRLTRQKKGIEKQMKRQRVRLELNEVQEFAAIDELHDPQRFADEFFERIRKKDVTLKGKMVLLHLLSLIIARHRLLVPNLYSYLLKYLTYKQRFVTKFLAIAAQAVHSDIPIDVLEPLIKQIMDEFVTEDRSDEAITVGINTMREIASRSPHIIDMDQIAHIALFRQKRSKAVSTATRAFINLYREVAPQLLHPSMRGREAGTKLTKMKRGQSDSSKPKISSSEIYSQEYYDRIKHSGQQETQQEEYSDNDEDQELEFEEDEDQEEGNEELEFDEDENQDGEFYEDRDYEEESSDDSDGEAGTSKRRKLDSTGGTDPDSSSAAEPIRITSDGSKTKKSKQTPDISKEHIINNNESSDSDDDSEAEALTVDSEALKFGSKKKKEATRSRQEAYTARLERKKQRLVAESRSGKRQSTTNEVKARNKPVLMTKYSKKVIEKRNQNISEKMAHLKNHLKSLKKGNAKYKKRRH